MNPDTVSRRTKGWNPAVFSAIVMIMMMIVGCDRGPNDDRSGRDGSGIGIEEKAGWHREGDELVGAVDDAVLQRALDEAIAMARATADEARARWQRANAIERERWLIKWEAPIHAADEVRDASPRAPQVEYIWVRPIEWSAFRIEGELLSRPRHEIGWNYGDLVSFPIEQLADWVYKLHGTMDGPRQGGFTVEVLEHHLGTPREPR